MEITVGNNSKTYFSVRNEFSEAHYDLPRNHGMFDIDLYKGQWLDIIKESTNENATYVEYRCLKYDNTGNKFDINRFKTIALFEYKYHNTQNVTANLILPEGTAMWASYMFSKVTKSRFFVVIGTHGSPPFTFYEYDDFGNYKEVGKLIYFPWDRKEEINNFWKYTLNIT